ncbi:bifunctional ADP-dependent NAD(P)H-hydrate dehydratase/NAD(P)H-hydrate epimerase, partial [Ornithinicoccus halotolerans]|uniref:bifunctional ADP-dependent NAD(P)H-hydrate dehydratase/NAD(P)H-hydrate epimerase n=1 Tax=Ornithinicoccus halotolerans TaxID=1748220 RepID=UPI0012970363
MIAAYAVPDVRAAEAAAMAQLPDGELMARAAAGLAQVLAARVRGRTRVVVLAGPGDNGGDALYAAAGLATDLPGAQITAVLVSEQVHPGALAAARESGVRLLPPGEGDEPASEATEALGRAAVVVDGMLGIGGRPGLRGTMARLAAAVPDEAYVVAVDLPSGQDPAGRVSPAAAVTADETVTFGVPKPLHLLPATEAACGLLTVVDIGLTEQQQARRLLGAPAVERLTHDDAAQLWPVPGLADDKYSRGVVGVLAGSEQYPGAAVLVSRGAVEAGAGMVRYVGPRRAQDLVLAAMPEVVPGPGRVQAWVVGPGLPVPSGGSATADRDETERLALARDVLAGELAEQPCVVDAGALDLVTGRRPGPTLLTPHAGELARLLSRLAGRQLERADVTADPAECATLAARLTGATVLLKGGTT